MRDIRTKKQFTVDAWIIGAKKGCPEVRFNFNGRNYKAVLPGQVSMSKATKNFNKSVPCLVAFNFNPKKSIRTRVSKLSFVEFSHRRYRYGRPSYFH